MGEECFAARHVPAASLPARHSAPSCTADSKIPPRKPYHPTVRGSSATHSHCGHGPYPKGGKAYQDSLSLGKERCPPPAPKQNRVVRTHVPYQECVNITSYKHPR